MGPRAAWLVGETHVITDHFDHAKMVRMIRTYSEYADESIPFRSLSVSREEHPK